MPNYPYPPHPQAAAFRAILHLQRKTLQQWGRQHGVHNPMVSRVLLGSVASARLSEAITAYVAKHRPLLAKLLKTADAP